MSVIPISTKYINYVRNCHHSLRFQWVKYTNEPIYIKEIWNELWYFNDNFMHFVEYSLIFRYWNLMEALFFCTVIVMQSLIFPLSIYTCFEQWPAYKIRDTMVCTWFKNWFLFIDSTAIAVPISEGCVTKLHLVSIALINEYNKGALDFASLKIGFQENDFSFSVEVSRRIDDVHFVVQRRWISFCSWRHATDIVELLSWLLNITMAVYGDLL